MREYRYEVDEIWRRDEGKKGKGPGVECVRMAPNMEASGPLPQATVDAKCHERVNGRMRWADSGEEEEESVKGERKERNSG